MNQINLSSLTITLLSERHGTKIIPRGAIDAEVVEALLERHRDDEQALWAAIDGFLSKPRHEAAMDMIPEDMRGHFSLDHGQVLFDGSLRVPNSFFGYITNPNRASRAVAFLGKLKKNPYPDNHYRVFDFLKRNNLPISADGSIYAYKAVRQNFFDYYTSSVRYYPGDKPALDPSCVDTVTHNLCSAGLHFCSYSYMSRGYFGSSSARIVLIKVDPEDIASIPLPACVDAQGYDDAKGRAFKLQSIVALRQMSHDHFMVMNDSLNHCDDDQIEAIIERYIDTDIPCIEDIEPPAMTVRNILTPLNEQTLGDICVVAEVKVGSSIYEIWSKRKNGIVMRIAETLGIAPQDIFIHTDFVVGHTDYPRLIRMIRTGEAEWVATEQRANIDQADFMRISDDDGDEDDDMEDDWD